MGRTPDRFPGTREEEELLFETNAPDPTDDGAVRYNGTSFRMKDSTGVFDPRTGGTGLTAATHRPLDQLVHNIAEDSFEEYTYTASRVTKLTIWTDNGKTIKIRESDFTYSGSQIATAVTRQYDAAGVLIVGDPMTESFTFTGSNVTSIERVMS
jgi:hypothetical protein